MKFLFQCPVTGLVYETEDFTIKDKGGVKTDASGNKFLDAEVIINIPCPLCGKKHAYRADELSCPFGK